MFRGVHRAGTWRHACPICFDPTDGEQCGRHHVLPDGDTYRDLAHFLLVGAGLSPAAVRVFPCFAGVADAMAQRLNPASKPGPLIPLPRLTAGATWPLSRLLRVPIHIRDTLDAAFTPLSRTSAAIYVHRDGTLLVPQPPFEALREVVYLEDQCAAGHDDTYGDVSWLDDPKFYHEIGPFDGPVGLPGP